MYMGSVSSFSFFNQKISMDSGELFLEAMTDEIWPHLFTYEYLTGKVTGMPSIVRFEILERIALN